LKRIALAVVGVAVVGLAACSHPATPTAAHTTAPARASPIVPVSCRQQFDTWRHGQGKGVMAALGAVSSAGTAGDARTLTDALQKARPAIARAARHPIPACANPRGYWDVLLMHVNAAAGGKGSSSSARAAMTGVPKIEHELTTELKSTAE
jgi:hypothetical protein